MKTRFIRFPPPYMKLLTPSNINEPEQYRKTFKLKSIGIFSSVYVIEMAIETELIHLREPFPVPTTRVSEESNRCMQV